MRHSRNRRALLTPTLHPKTPSLDSLGWGGILLQAPSTFAIFATSLSYWSKQWDTWKEMVGKKPPQADIRASKEPPCFHGLS